MAPPTAVVASSPVNFHSLPTRSSPAGLLNKCRRFRKKKKGSKGFFLEKRFSSSFSLLFPLRPLLALPPLPPLPPLTSSFSYSFLLFLLQSHLFLLFLLPSLPFLPLLPPSTSCTSSFSSSFNLFLLFLLFLLPSLPPSTSTFYSSLHVFLLLLSHAAAAEAVPASEVLFALYQNSSAINQCYIFCFFKCSATPF